MDMKLIYDPRYRCPRCGKAQWMVPMEYQQKIYQNKGERDKAFQKRVKENEKLLDQKVCQYCDGGGERHSMLTPKQLKEMF